MIYDIPADPRRARPILQRFLAENASQAQGNLSGRRRPQPPRDPVVASGSLEALLTWKSPHDSSIIGYNIYQDNENNCIMTIALPNTGQARVKLAANAATGFYISSFNSQKESVKVPVVAQALTDQYVITGTGGATAGITAPTPPGYIYKRLRYQRID